MKMWLPTILWTVGSSPIGCKIVQVFYKLDKELSKIYQELRTVTR